MGASPEATTPWQLLVPRPLGTSASAAAALPTVYTTVDVAFAELAKLKKGEKAWPNVGDISNKDGESWGFIADMCFLADLPDIAWGSKAVGFFFF